VEVRRQVLDLARCGTRVAQPSETLGMSEATIHNWFKQEKIDSGEIEGQSTRAMLAWMQSHGEVSRVGVEQTGHPPCSPLTALAVNGHRLLPKYGHRFSPPAAMFSPHWWP
jgi:hypothetical protein